MGGGSFIPDVEPFAETNQSAAAAYRQETLQLVARGTPVAVAILVFFGITSGAVEYFYFPQRGYHLLALTGAYLVLGLAHLATIRIRPAWTFPATVLVENAITLSVIVYFASVHGSAELCVLILGAMLTGQVLMHPWDLRGQALGSLSVLIGYPIGLRFGIVPVLPAVYSVFALNTIVALTMFGARTLDRHRRAAFRHARELEHANAVQREEQEFSACVLELGRSLSAIIADPAALHEELTKQTRWALGVDWVILYRWAEDLGKFQFTAGSGMPDGVADEFSVVGMRTQFAPDLARALLETGAAEITTQDQRPLLPLSMLERWQIHGLRIQTITRDQQFIGLLSCVRTTGDGAFTAQQRRLLAGIASQAALALTNAGLVESARRGEQVKAEFLATASHELRTPLNVILGYSDLLIDGAYGQMPPEQIEPLSRVRQQSLQLLDLIQGMLDLNRLEARGLAVAINEFSVQELLDSVSLGIPEGWARPGVRLEWRPRDPATILWSDRNKVAMVLRNLIHNALKYTEHGQVTVFAEAQHAAERVQFTVVDTGSGIATEDLPGLFDMFVQGTTGPRGGGVGLGLYIVKRLTDALGGQIAVDSRPGSGTRFVLTLPIDGLRQRAVA